MTLEVIRDALAWCTVINWGILFFWAIMLLATRDWVYRIHGSMFALSREQFDAIHYRGMAPYKVAILLFNFVPYLALRIVG
jgi:hypothetical protein